MNSSAGSLLDFLGEDIVASPRSGSFSPARVVSETAPKDTSSSTASNHDSGSANTIDAVVRLPTPVVVGQDPSDSVPTVPVSVHLAETPPVLSSFLPSSGLQDSTENQGETVSNEKQSSRVLEITSEETSSVCVPTAPLATDSLSAPGSAGEKKRVFPSPMV